MPDRPSDAEEADQDRESADPSVAGSSIDSVDTSDGEDTSVGAPKGEDDSAADASRKARIEAAKRRYRATLRNEAETGGDGFSEDYYRSQKPPHWS